MDIWESSDTSGRPFHELLLQIIFLGAPHNGIDTDALSTLVGGQPSLALIQDLTPGSGVLVNLNDDFAEKLKSVGRDIKILSVVETRKTRTVTQVCKPPRRPVPCPFQAQSSSYSRRLTCEQHSDGTWTRAGPEILVVRKLSAVLGFGKETVLESNSDHLRIAKLYNSESSMFYDVQRTIITAVQTIGLLAWSGRTGRFEGVEE